MNNRIIELSLAAILFLAAYRTFDSSDATYLTISMILGLSGVHMLFKSSESPSRRRLGRSCLRLGAVMSIFLLVKILIFG
ncbi:MAG: hypothetical protein LC730_05560 [Acidobacteria bacterium]|nr:hypothetical protein [Acidobacteriota bacterium]MCA1608909.1 hypothetical protein [Acidobacteriota bacterium]